MKATFRILMTVCFASFFVMGKAQQQIADLVLTGGPSKATYTGYPVAGTFDVTLGNNTNVNINAGAFRIIVSLPPGFVFDATYPNVPAGWTYTKLNDLSAYVVPNAVVDGTPPFAYYGFSFPFKTSAPVTNGSYLAQAQSLTPAFVDPVLTNNQVGGFVNVSNVVLPVDFLNISASINNCTAEVSWKTANQINLKHYELESSLDGINFTTGKTVAVNNLNAYAVELPINGNNTYFFRVKAVDLDGKIRYSAITSVKSNCDGKQGAFSMFPNPVLKGKMVNLLSSTTEKTTFRILDMGGKIVKEGNFTGQTNFQLNIGGTYVVDLQSASTSEKYKLVVQ